MILYFSGTGNSRYIAEGISKLSGDEELISMNLLMKHSDDVVLESDKPFVFIMPVHAFRIPRLLDDFIRGCKFKGSKDAYCIVDCGGTPGNTYKYVKKTMKKVNLNLKGFDAINMPASYLLMYDVVDPNAEDTIKALNHQRAQIESIANSIKNGEGFFRRTGSFKGSIFSTLLNPIFCKRIKANDFYYTDACINCGTCVNRCPLNNIRIIDHHPNWGDNCMHCMACIAGCPQRAIEYKGKSEGRGRYFLTKHFD